MLPCSESKPLHIQLSDQGEERQGWEMATWKIEVGKWVRQLWAPRKWRSHKQLHIK